MTGQRMWPDHAVLACRIAGEDRWCQQCGGEGVVRDTVVRRLAHEPYGWHPTILHVSVRRYRCPECAHVWRQNMSAAADPRVKLSRSAVRWALTGLVVHHLTVARIADVLAVSWNTANTAILGEGQRLLINEPARCEGVRVIGVDEHVWRHTPPTATNTSPSSWTSLPYVTVVVPPGSWTWSQADPGGSSKPGWPPAPTRGAATSRSSQWMDSPGSKALPPKSSQTRGRSWTPSTSCTLPVMLSMSAAGISGKNFTIGAGGPRIPCTRPAGCYTPDPACSPHANNTS